MKAEQFSESLNQIHDRYIVEAVTYQAPLSQKVPSGSSKTSRSMRVWRGIAIAACALLAVGISVTAISLLFGGKTSYQAGSAADAPDYNYRNGAGSYDGGSYDTYDTYETYYEDGILNSGFRNEDGYTESSGPMETEEVAGNFASTMPANENSKIIYTAYLTIDTTEFEDAQKQIETITKAQGGYFENLDQGNFSSSYRSATYQIRVPAENFDAFLKETKGCGTVTSISQNASDVSDYYYDVESRLETAKTKLARLQDLLSQAQNMTDIITIEGEIANVQWEIDDLSGTLQHYDSQVNYSPSRSI